MAETDEEIRQAKIKSILSEMVSFFDKKGEKYMAVCVEETNPPSMMSLMKHSDFSNEVKGDIKNIYDIFENFFIFQHKDTGRVFQLAKHWTTNCGKFVTIKQAEIFQI